MSRRIFNHPIRKETTESFFPEEIDIIDFRCVIVDSFPGFERNMEQLRNSAENKYVLEKQFIEKWVEQYLAWLEIEEER